jgi:hypothetical protein
MSLSTFVACFIACREMSQQVPNWHSVMHDTVDENCQNRQHPPYLLGLALCGGRVALTEETLAGLSICCASVFQ